MPPKYRFSLTNETGDRWYYVANNQVLLSVTPKYIEEPQDWAEMTVGLARNEKYYGVFTELTYPQSFVLTSKKVLQYVYAREGCEGVVRLRIEESNRDNWAYDSYYDGELDLSAIEVVKSIRANHFQSNITTGGKLALLKANADTPYEIPFDGDSFLIHHDGINLDVNYKWFIAPTSPNTIPPNSVLPIAIVTDDGSDYIANDIFLTDQNLETYATTPQDANRFLNTNKTQVANYTLTGTFSATNTLANNKLYISIARKDTVTNTITYTDIYTSPLISGGLTNITLNLAGSITFDPSTVNYFLVFRQLLVGGLTGIAFDNAYFGLSFKYKSDPTDIRVYRYYTFLDKLLKSALGNDTILESSYLNTSQSRYYNYDNDPYWTTITSGTAIRKLSDPKIKTTINEAKQDMERWGLGLDIIGNKVIIERLPYFFQSERKIFTLSGVQSVSYRNANNWMGNTLKTGYKTQTYDDLNGRQDFHTTTIWGLSIKRVVKELDWSSPYYAGIFPIEYARNQGFGKKDSTDTQYDDQIYLMEVDNVNTVGGKPTLYRPAGTYKIGLNNPETAYNFGLTPARTPLFNKERLIAVTRGTPFETGFLRFQKTDKNASVATQLESIFVDEDAFQSFKVYYGKLPAGNPATPSGANVKPLYQPLIWEVEAQVPENLFSIVKADPQNKYGVITFPHEGNLYDMFILDIARTAKDDIYNIIGLSSPNNDLTKLYAAGS